MEVDQFQILCTWLRCQNQYKMVLDIWKANSTMYVNIQANLSSLCVIFYFLCYVSQMNIAFYTNTRMRLNVILFQKKVIIK